MKQGFQYNEHAGVVYLTVPAFTETGLVRHCTTTRKGGVSEGPYATMNLHLVKNDTMEHMLENWRILGRELGIRWEDAVSTKQVHSDRIVMVTEADRGMGITKPAYPEGFDGLLTNVPGVPLVAYSADCVPLSFLDPVKRVIGVAHSGWKGTVQMIGMKMVQRMQIEYGSNPSDILVAIGPSIGKECFEIEEDALQVFQDAFSDLAPYLTQKNESKYLIDLWGLNVKLLMESEVQPEHITVCGLCTMCDTELFYSYRGQGRGKNGSLATIIELK